MMHLIPCTACRYCLEGCPQKLDIPKLISMYNESSNAFSGLLKFTLDAMGESELPSACLACGACSKLCPQGIDVPDVMRRYAALLAK